MDKNTYVTRVLRTQTPHNRGESVDELEVRNIVSADSLHLLCYFKLFYTFTPVVRCLCSEHSSL